MRRLILASGSPRRRELIRANRPTAETLVTVVDESVSEGTPPDAMVREVAVRKARAAGPFGGNAVIIGADTTVALDGGWLGKPSDDAEARKMLNRLQAREHSVFTAVAVATGGNVLTDVTMSAVIIRPLAAEDIAAYVASGEGLDKAGAYSIQGDAGEIVAGVEGCYTNVVGLPLCTLALLLARAGVAIDLAAPPCGYRSGRRCPHPIWRPS